MIARRWFLALALIAALPAALAQPMGAVDDDFIYQVRAGDTLIALSQTYTGTPNHWPTLQSLNQVADPYALPIGKALRIPFSLIPEEAARASVVHVQGQVQRNGQPLHTNAWVVEGDRLSTGANSYLTLLLPDDSQASLPANARARVGRLRSFSSAPLVDTIFELETGAVESDVAPDGRGTGRYEIRSPISITGVRGTRLRVRMGTEGMRSEVLSGAAQLQTPTAGTQRLRAMQGAGVDPEGRLMAVRPLLPAPRLHPEPDAAPGRPLAFDPVPGAQAYLVRVAADALGLRPVSTQRIDGPPAQYAAPGPGTWHVLVRAIDAGGLMSDDAVFAFDGRAILKSGTGLPVHTGTGDLVLLTQY